MERQQGFTLIELLVTLALAAILATGGFLMFSNYRNENHLKDEGSKVKAVLDNTRENSISQLNGAGWGIHFENGTSSDTYQQWSGTSFATGTLGNAYSLGYNLTFGDPATSSQDVFFAPLTGMLTNDAAVTVAPSPGSGMAENFIINTLGKITQRFETNLVGYWPFDTGTGTTAYDASGYGDAGTFTGSPVWQSGQSCKVDDCLGFSSGNYLTVGDVSALNLSSSFTVSFWLKANVWNTGGSPGIISKEYYNGSPRRGYVIYDDGSSNCSGSCAPLINLRIEGASGSALYLYSGSSVTTGQWEYWAVTYDASSQTVWWYKNGQPDRSFTGVNVGDFSSSNPFYIGHTQTWNGYLNGSLDDLRIYSRALSAQEILDLYNAY